MLTESHMSTVTSTGTFAWAAPELLLGNKVSEIADIYRCAHAPPGKAANALWVSICIPCRPAWSHRPTHYRSCPCAAAALKLCLAWLCAMQCRLCADLASLADDIGALVRLCGPATDALSSGFLLAARSLLVCLDSFGVVLWELVTGEQPKRGQLRSIR